TRAPPGTPPSPYTTLFRSRVRSVMAELGQEKIDIVDWSRDPAAFITQALSPAKVISVEILDEAARSARATVPADQLSLAIGKERSEEHTSELQSRFDLVCR